MRPDHGGRLELKLTAASTGRARYMLTLYTLDSELSTHVDVELASGALEIADWPTGAPPAWLLSFARALLRSVWRSRISAGEWPRRVTRWRPEPKP